MTRAGSLGRFDTLGVWSHYHANSTITIPDPNFPVAPIEMETEMIGRFGYATGLEYFVCDDVAVFFGGDYRRLMPESEPGFAFESITYTEWFLGWKWVAPPMRPAPSTTQRLRPFLSAKVGYVPRTEFHATLDWGEPFTAADLAFEGNSYWNLGLAAGLMYQLDEHLVAHASLAYEWPLSTTEDAFEVDVLPGFFDPIPLEGELEPEGFLGLLGVTYYF